MSVRSTLNSHPMITAGAILLVIVLAGYFAYSTTATSRPKVLPMFLSTDNGATWFESMTGELPPVKQPDGKIAVRVYLFKCEDGKTFVGYLEKYTDEAKTLLDEARTNKGKPNMAELPKLQAAATRGLLVKRPTDKNWTSAASDVRNVTCPDKSRAVAVQY